MRGRRVRRLLLSTAAGAWMVAAATWPCIGKGQAPTPRPPDAAVPKVQERGQVGTLPPPAPSLPPSGAIPPELVRPRDLSPPTPAPAPMSYTITLGPRRACAVPSTEKLAVAEGGTIDVESPSADTITVLLSGTTAASAYLGCHSSARMTMDLVQEFEIASSGPSDGFVVFDLDSTLVGYLRSKDRGGARVTLASATIAPLGCDNCGPVVLSHPPQAIGGKGGQMCNLRLTPLKSPPMPLGQYRLTARFVIEASSGGLCDGHSAADFSPDVTLADPFVRPRDPFQGASKKGFGFNLTIKATPPGPSVRVAARPSRPR